MDFRWCRCCAGCRGRCCVGWSGRWCGLIALRRLAEWLVTPAVAWLGMNVAYLAWHVPAAYNFALENETVHGLEHLCFLFTSLLFWWYIFRPWPAKQRPR